MSKIAIITDSTASIPQDLVEKHHITVIPQVLIWENKTYRDRIDIQPDEFYSRLKTAKVMPSTSQATPAAFHQLFQQLLEQENEILAILISNRLSGTLSSAYQAQMVVEKGNSYEELVAGYRPLASSSEGNLVLDRRVNNVRIYVVNLNASQPLQSSGEFHMRVVCFNVLSQAHSYNLSSSVTTLVLTAVLGDDEDAIVVPLIVGPSGSTVKLEVVVSSVVIEEVRV